MFPFRPHTLLTVIFSCHTSQAFLLSFVASKHGNRVVSAYNLIPHELCALACVAAWVVAVPCDRELASFGRASVGHTVKQRGGARAVHDREDHNTPPSASNAAQPSVRAAVRIMLIVKVSMCLTSLRVVRGLPLPSDWACRAWPRARLVSRAFRRCVAWSSARAACSWSSSSVALCDASVTHHMQAACQ